jgi:hypothetical protein
MDKAAFVNFFTNMQCKYLDEMDEQFDITDADAVDAIYNTLNNTLLCVRVNLVLDKVAE